MRVAVIFGSSLSNPSTSLLYAAITGVRVGAPWRCGGDDEFMYLRIVLRAMLVSRETRFFGSAWPTQRSRMTCQVFKLINPPGSPS